jgi:hypothetical protein
MFLYRLARRDGTRSSVYDAHCCPERYPPTAVIRTGERQCQGFSALDECPAEDRAIVDAGLKALAFDSGPAARLRRARRDLRAGFGRARQARPIGRHQPARARRQDPADPRPLRPDRQPLRLVCLRPRQPRRASLADHRPRRGELTFVAGHQPPEGEPILCGSEPTDQSRPSVATP